MREGANIDAQVRPFDDLLAETCVSRELVDYICALLRRQGITLIQRRPILSERPIASFLRSFLDVGLQVGWQLLVIAGDPGEARENQRIRDIVGLRELQRFETQHGREQNNAVERDSAIGEIARDSCRTCSAIALAE